MKTRLTSLTHPKKDSPFSTLARSARAMLYVCGCGTFLTCQLVISKEHAQFMHELSDESLQDILPVAKRVAKAINADNYNILQVSIFTLTKHG